MVGFVQANPNRVLQFGASGQFLLRRLPDYRIVTRVRVQCCRTCHTTTYSPMSRTAGETYPKAMTKLESQELYDKLSWNCFSMNLHYSIPFIVTYSDSIIYSYISAVVSAKSSSATTIVDSSLKFGQALAQVGLPLRLHADRGSEGAEAPFCCWVARAQDAQNNVKNVNLKYSISKVFSQAWSSKHGVFQHGLRFDPDLVGKLQPLFYQFHDSKQILGSGQGAFINPLPVPFLHPFRHDGSIRCRACLGLFV